VRASFEAVVRDPDGRTFGVPTIELGGFRPFQLVGPVNAAVEELCGARVTTLRCLSSEATPDGGRHRRYELEAHGRVHGLSEVEAELPPAWNDWEQPGWYDEAEAWLGERADAPVEQRSVKSISAFLRAGDAFLKAVPELFATEPAITAALYRHHPDLVPEVLDVDVERRWLLTRDFGGPLLYEAPLPARRLALEAYAGVQRSWVGRSAELLALGCADRTLAPLEADIDRVFADVDAMPGLEDDELAALPQLRARLHAAGRRVASFDIPATLDHGDLHTGNIAMRDGKPVVFDWSDGCLALPLVSITPMLVWDELAARTRRELRDAYVRAIGAPLEAYDDAMLLGLAHQAVSYHRINEGTAPYARWEWEHVLPWIVKQLLERLPR
jgi:phosphotransferase family enzyme